MGSEEEWRRKGATLSDKLDPWEPRLRLLRREVEELLNSTYNDRLYNQRRAKAELARVDKELKQLRIQVAALEDRRAQLLADLGE